MLTLSKTKVGKEYIYANKHVLHLYSLEEVSSKFKNSDDKVSDIVDFYLNSINFDKLRFIIKLVTNMDGKNSLTQMQIKDYTTQLFTKAVENYINNSMDGVYISEHIVVVVFLSGSKHYISICPKIDFLK